LGPPTKTVRTKKKSNPVETKRKRKRKKWWIGPNQKRRDNPRAKSQKRTKKESCTGLNKQGETGVEKRKKTKTCEQNQSTRKKGLKSQGKPELMRRGDRAWYSPTGPKKTGG